MNNTDIDIKYIIQESKTPWEDDDNDEFIEDEAEEE